MAALLRRRVVSFLVIALAMILVPAAALASGRDVLDDLDADGRIDSCYTAREYNQAIRLLRPNDAQYGADVDVIRQALVEKVVAREGDPCPPPETVAADEGDDGGGSSALVWLGVAAVVGAVAVGTGAWVRRRRSGDGPPDADA